jgi:hypothetical protein
MVTQQLEDEGVQKFITAFDSLMNTLQEKRATALHEHVEGRPGSHSEPEAEAAP